MRGAGILALRDDSYEPDDAPPAIWRMGKIGARSAPEILAVFRARSAPAEVTVFLEKLGLGPLIGHTIRRRYAAPRLRDVHAEQLAHAPGARRRHALAHTSASMSQPWFMDGLKIHVSLQPAKTVITIGTTARERFTVNLRASPSRRCQSLTGGALAAGGQGSSWRRLPAWPPARKASKVRRQPAFSHSKWTS